MKKMIKTKGRVEDYDKELGIRLRAIRKLHNYTQETLANKLDITFQQVQKYEQGTNRISASKIKQVMDIFHTPPSYFFEEHKHVAQLGLSENDQSPFEGETLDKEQSAVKNNTVNILQSTETINLLRAYYSVSDAKARKDMLKMVRSYADNITKAQKS